MIYDTPTQRAEHRSSVPVNDAKTQQYSFYLLVWLKCCEKNTDFYKMHPHFSRFHPCFCIAKIIGSRIYIYIMVLFMVFSRITYPTFKNVSFTVSETLNIQECIKINQACDKCVVSAIQLF